MIETLVWAFQPLRELNNQTGFVACESKLAEELIAAGKAQDPRDGAHHLKEIQTASVDTYETKVMTPRKSRKSLLDAPDAE